jgi:hypothetical protein
LFVEYWILLVDFTGGFCWILVVGRSVWLGDWDSFDVVELLFRLLRWGLLLVGGTAGVAQW